MTETPTTPEATDDELIAIAKSVPLGHFLYRPIYDAGVAAGRTQALEEAARIADGCVTDDRLDAPDVESDARARLIAERIRAAAAREGHN